MKMKNKFMFVALISLLSMGVFLTSCEEEDETPSFTKEQLVGLWYLTTHTEIYDGDDDGKNETYTESHNPSGKYYIKINEDNTLEMEFGRLYLLDDRSGYSQKKYYLEGNKLFISEKKYFLIESCNASTLILSWTDPGIDTHYLKNIAEFVKQ